MFNVCSDLYEVVENLNDTSKRIEIEVTYFFFFFSFFFDFQYFMYLKVYTFKYVLKCLSIIIINIFFLIYKLRVYQYFTLFNRCYVKEFQLTVA